MDPLNEMDIEARDELIDELVTAAADGIDATLKIVSRYSSAVSSAALEKAKGRLIRWLNDAVSGIPGTPAFNTNDFMRQYDTLWLATMAAQELNRQPNSSEKRGS